MAEKDNIMNKYCERFMIQKTWELFLENKSNKAPSSQFMKAVWDWNLEAVKGY